MAKVTYTPVADHGDNGETRQAGYTFEKGKSVEVKDERALAKFKANPNFTVAGEKAQADAGRDDKNVSSETPPPPSIANMVYPSQPPGVGSKTAAIPRPEGSVEAAIEAHGGDLKAAAEATAETADRLQSQAETLARVQKASEPKKPRKSGGKAKSKSKRK